jgi:hypothetical protein
MKRDKVGYGIPGNNERAEIIPGCKHQRLSGTQIDAAKVNCEPEFLEHAGSEIVITHARASGQQEQIAASGEVFLDALSQCRAVIAYASLRDQRCASVS